MPLKQLRSVTGELDTPELLRYLITEKFPGETVVTASLMSSSTVVLKMVADIDPATPVIFCQRPPVFEESAEFRASIVDRLGLKNVSTSDGRESTVHPGDRDHCEDMWVSNHNMPGNSYQILHLNDCLSPYKCWISAVYHVPPVDSVNHRVDKDGRLIKVDPLVKWSKERVRNFMIDNDLPYHKMAMRDYQFDRARSVATETFPF